MIPRLFENKEKQRENRGAFGSRDVTLTSPDVPDRLRNLSVCSPARRLKMHKRGPVGKSGVIQRDVLLGGGGVCKESGQPWPMWTGGAGYETAIRG